jgi:hypothetical protein
MNKKIFFGLLLLLFGETLYSQNAPFYIWGNGLNGTLLQKTAIYSDVTNGLLIEAPLNANNEKLPISFSWRGGGLRPIYILPNGYVGLGTTTPRGVLDVRGTTFLGTSGNFIFHAGNELNYMYESEQNEGWWINYRGTGNKDQFRDFYIGNGKGNSVLMVDGSEASVGLGTTTPRGVLDVRGTTFLGTSGNFIFHAGNELNYMYESEQNEGWWINYRGTGNKDQFRDFHIGNGKGNSVLMVDGSISSVGIGTSNPDSKLDVRGKIKATEIEITAPQTADFVFEEDYQLKPLSEVEQFVKENKHLPEIPSAKKMEKDGVNLAEMNKLLLQKVEELTLYLIEKDKRVSQLEKEILEIKKKIK